MAKPTKKNTKPVSADAFIAGRDDLIKQVKSWEAGVKETYYRVMEAIPPELRAEVLRLHMVEFVFSDTSATMRHPDVYRGARERLGDRYGAYLKLASAISTYKPKARGPVGK